jgi:polyisoprenoid-binding protein YceI
MKLVHMFLAVALGASVAACKNPADGKDKAQVGEAKPEPAAAPAPTPADPAANAPAVPAAGAQTFKIAPDTSNVAITASKVTKTHKIKINSFTGTATVPDGKIESAQAKIEFDMNTIEADEEGLTKHLKSPDFFDTAKIPSASFTTTEIKAGGDKGATHTVTGNLDMHGVKKSVTFPATIALAGDKLTVKSEFVINRKDWGIVYAGKADDLIRDEVIITLDLAAPVAK